MLCLSFPCLEGKFSTTPSLLRCRFLRTQVLVWVLGVTVQGGPSDPAVPSSSGDPVIPCPADCLLPDQTSLTLGRPFRHGFSSNSIRTLLDMGLASSALLHHFRMDLREQGGFEGDTDPAASAFLALFAINKEETDFIENM